MRVPLKLALAITALSCAPLAICQTANTYSIAFQQQNLPSNVDQMVTAAGGTIVTRIPEIGGIGVQSSDPNFLSKIGQNPSVRAADVAVQASVPAQQDLGASGSGSTNNSNFSPAGPDPQPMPDSLGNQQWDKMRMK